MEVKGSGRTYGGRTADEREAERRAALLEAALDLVAADGLRELRIDAVCRAAGLNKRYFYAAFADVDALAAALLESLAAATIDRALAEVDLTDPREVTIRRTLTVLVEHLTDDPRRARVLFGSVAASDAAAEHRSAAVHRVVTAVADEGRQLHPQADGTLATTVASMLVGGTTQAVLDWLDGVIPGPREELVDHLVALWLGIDEVVSGHVGG